MSLAEGTPLCSQWRCGSHTPVQMGSWWPSKPSPSSCLGTDLLPHPHQLQPQTHVGTEAVWLGPQGSTVTPPQRQINSVLFFQSAGRWLPRFSVTNTAHEGAGSLRWWSFPCSLTKTPTSLLSQIRELSSARKSCYLPYPQIFKKWLWSEFSSGSVLWLVFVVFFYSLIAIHFGHT